MLALISSTVPSRMHHRIDRLTEAFRVWFRSDRSVWVMWYWGVADWMECLREVPEEFFSVTVLVRLVCSYLAHPALPIRFDPSAGTDVVDIHTDGAVRQRIYRLCPGATAHGEKTFLWTQFQFTIQMEHPEQLIAIGLTTSVVAPDGLPYQYGLYSHGQLNAYNDNVHNNNFLSFYDLWQPHSNAFPRNTVTVLADPALRSISFQVGEVDLGPLLKDVPDAIMQQLRPFVYFAYSERDTFVDLLK